MMAEEMTLFERTALTLLGQMAEDLAAIRQALAEENDARSNRIDGYIRGRNEGGDFVWLYSEVPRVKNKVVTVYMDDPLWERLPLGAWEGAPVCDASQAPPRDAAVKHPCYVAVEPFTVSTVKRDDSNPFGYKVVLAGVSAWSAPGELPAPLSPPAVTSPAPPPARQADPRPTATPPPPEPDGAPGQRQAQAQSERRRRRRRAHGAQAQAIERSKPLSPEVLPLWLAQEAGRLNREASKLQTADTHNALEILFPVEAQRRAVQAHLTGHRSMADMPGAMILALHAWLKPAPGNGPVDEFVAIEARDVLEWLGELENEEEDGEEYEGENETPGSHPVWASSEDAARWAVQMGLFLTLDVAQHVLTKKWHAWGKPEQGVLFRRWDEFVRSQVPAQPRLEGELADV